MQYPCATAAGTPGVNLKRHIDAMTLHSHAVTQHVSIDRGPMFTLPSDYRNCIRLNVGQPWDARVEHALEVLGRLANEAQ